MILIVSDYSYNDGGVVKGSYYQILLYFQDGRFFRKAKEFAQDVDNVYPNSTLPKIQVLTEEEMLDYSNLLPLSKELLLEFVRDSETVYKFYRNPYRNLHSYKLVKIMKPWQINW